MKRANDATAVLHARAKFEKFRGIQNRISPFPFPESKTGAREARSGMFSSMSAFFFFFLVAVVPPLKIVFPPAYQGT